MGSKIYTVSRRVPLTVWEEDKELFLQVVTNRQRFVRDAIQEKLERDYPGALGPPVPLPVLADVEDCPASGLPFTGSEDLHRTGRDAPA